MGNNIDDLHYLELAIYHSLLLCFVEKEPDGGAPRTTGYIKIVIAFLISEVDCKRNI
jgi:hypothetical protein